MAYTVHEAKTNLSKLLKEACSGKEVIIAKGRQPMAKLVAIGAARKKRIPGKFAGQFSAAESAFAPLTDQELEELGFA